MARLIEEKFNIIMNHADEITRIRSNRVDCPKKVEVPQQAEAPSVDAPVASGNLTRRRKNGWIVAVTFIVMLALFNVVGWGAYVEKARTALAEQRAYEKMMENGDESIDIDVPMVITAREQLGNYGGEKFIEWYGIDYHVDWCAIFVSWVADQTGYLETGQVPKFSYVPTAISYFKKQDRWKDGGSMPKAGDIIFFDWDADGTQDHVGIVVGVKDGRVFTIEGNSGFEDHLVDPEDEDSGSVDENGDPWLGECMRHGYDLDDPEILGYGIVDTEDHK